MATTAMPTLLPGEPDRRHNDAIALTLQPAAGTSRTAGLAHHPPLSRSGATQVCLSLHAAVIATGRGMARTAGGWMRTLPRPRLTRASGLGLLLLMLPLAQPGPARAEKARWALACVGTETGYTVNFSYRWGSEGWRQTSVEPGKWIKLYWSYDYPGQNRSPTLTIRYDDDLTNRSNFVRTDLKAYAASYLNCEDQGKTYNFYTRGDELYVQEED